MVIQKEIEHPSKMSCPVCQNTTHHKFVESFNIYRMYQCPNCNVIFSYPMQSSTKEDDKKGPLDDVYRWEFSQSIRDIPANTNRILDIGCGTGRFLNKIKKKGYDVWGIDLNCKMVEITKKRGGKNVYPLRIEEFREKFPNEKFDLICFFHTLEHIVDINDFIKTVYDLLTEKGYVIFCVPNPRRFISKFVKKRLVDYPPFHFTRWSKKSLEYLFIKGKFKVIKLEDLVPRHSIGVYLYIFNIIRIVSFRYLRILPEKLVRYASYYLSICLFIYFYLLFKIDIKGASIYGVMKKM